MTTEDLNRRRLDALVRHVTNVKQNCELLGERLIDKGEVDFGRHLIANGFIHDNSKFTGIEWQFLHQDVMESNLSEFKLAVSQHTKTNRHHPEFWIHINDMPRIYVAELVCDITARSQEFGDNVKDWLDDKGISKYQITKNTKKYKEINDFLKILLEKPFQTVPVR